MSDHTLVPFDDEQMKIIQSYRQNEARMRDEITRLRADYEGACKLVAEMHAAAVGEVRGPIRGVVEDVQDLRSRVAELLDALKRLNHVSSALRFLDVEGREEFEEAYPEFSDFLHGDLDEEWIQAMDQADAAIAKASPPQEA
jgi:hypothetical protein